MPLVLHVPLCLRTKHNPEALDPKDKSIILPRNVSKYQSTEHTRNPELSALFSFTSNLTFTSQKRLRPQTIELILGK